MKRLDRLVERLNAVLGDKLVSLTNRLGEVTIVIKADQLLEVATTLRDHEDLAFTQLIDLCGMDYLDYGDGRWEDKRFASVMHLLSINHNWRVRVRTFANDDDFPVIPSVVDIWNCVNWFERESFDLFGIIYDGHPDLRRILTDYGFVGHPFRKDFPISGYVEMRYDPTQMRVVYQPVTIEPREITPRIIREENYGG